MKGKMAKAANVVGRTTLFSMYIYSTLLSVEVNAATLNLSDLPLVVASNVPPNVVVSIDDSGSMAWGYMPDNVGSARYTRAYRSAHYNKVMYDPSITYDPPVQANGAPLPNASFTAAIRGYYYTSGAQKTIDLSSDYSAIYTHYSNNQPRLLDTDYVAIGCDATVCTEERAHYYEYNGAGCTGTAAQKLVNNNCYNKVVLAIADEANFANWFQYYGMRGDAAKTALMRAFAPDAVNNSVRVGRQTFNADQIIQSGSPTADVNGVTALGTNGERAKFFDWIKSVPTSGSTPLRASVVRAGEFYRTSNPYREDPSSSSSSTISCRVNTHMLVTDGFYNGSIANPSGFIDDNLSSISGGSYTLPDSRVYTPGGTEQKIYPNAHTSSSLADITFHYWASDLSAETNNVMPYFATDPADESALTDAEYWDPSNDPANWQHMVSYMVAFGLSGTVPVPDATVYAALLAGTTYTNNSGAGQIGWPNNNTNGGIADDVYHAGINGRGGFFNAADPDQLVSAFKDIVGNVQNRQASSTTVVADSGRISSNSLLYVARYDTGKWLGQLEAFDVSDGSSFDPNNPTAGTGCNAKPFGELCGSVWDAGNVNTESSLPHASRTIFSYKSTAASGDPAGTGIDFDWAQLDAGQQGLLNNGDGLGSQRLNFLRGDSSNEVDQGGSFRIRAGLTSGSSASRLGPIFHASPVYVGDGKDVNGLQQFDIPDNLESKSYLSFLSNIGGRTPMIYVGGNDGMLHAINATRGGGNEVFSYVPNAIYENLADLTDSTFQSGAYVDGAIAVQDVFYSSAWHSLLVGGLRSGGQGYYALDVTDPSKGATNIVGWEYTDKNDVDMGYSYGQPQMVRSNYNGGQWVVLVANGYNSTVADGNVGSGKAVLFVLDPADGSQIAKIEVGSATTSNGLSSPTAVFSDSDLNADYAYAGDLQGDLWRFDLTNSDPTQWSASKLFSAGTSRPITGKPSVGSHPSNGSGRVIYFGTGKYVEPSDTSSSSTQAFYAILDDDSCSSSGTACVSSGSLVQQTLSSAGSDNSSTSNNAVDWSSDKGWYLLLNNGSSASERVVGTPAIIGSAVLFLSIVPKNDPCDAGGSNYLYALGRIDGGKTDRQIIDINNDGVVNKTDMQSATGQNNTGVVNVYVMKNTSPLPDIGYFFSGGGGGGGSDCGKGSAISEEDAVTLDNSCKQGRIRWRQLK